MHVCCSMLHHQHAAAPAGLRSKCGGAQVGTAINATTCCEPCRFANDESMVSDADVRGNGVPGRGPVRAARTVAPHFLHWSSAS